MNGVTLSTPRDGVALVTLDRPDRMNALDDDLLVRSLPDTFDQLAVDPSVRVVVVTGAGRGFCAGADLDCAGFRQPDTLAAEAFMRASHRTPAAIRAMPQPSIAAVNGAAVGAGLGLALACDVRYAAPQAKLGAPFVAMGLVPDFGVSYFLPRLVGTDAALELLLSGRLVDGVEAARLGMVSRVTDDPLAAALDWAEVVAGMPPAAVAATRSNVYRGLEVDLATDLQSLEIRAQVGALFGDEFRQRFDAYRQALDRR